MKLGFIGIGVMGGPMAENLLKKSGCPVTVYDLERGAVEALAAKGAKAADSAAEAARDSDVIFTMLPRNEHVRAVYGELETALRPGQLFVDMSTISPAVSREIAQRVRVKGADFADAPVVKSRPAAVAGTLGIYVGGREETYEKILPLLLCMGENVIRLGDNGAGLVMKLCHNMLVAQIQNGVNEMTHLAANASGIDVQTFARAASFGGAQTFYLDSKAASLQRKDFTPAFAAAYMHKDVLLARELCAEGGLSYGGVQLAAERYEEVLARGWGKEDFSVSYRLFDSGEEQ